MSATNDERHGRDVEPPGATQAEIDEIPWYHEMEFPGGLRSTSTMPGVAGNRRIWHWIDAQLAEIDFAGRSVLDVGCWDGRYSFLAESRGAASVTAVDDVSQRWGGSAGVEMAHRLLGSSVELVLDQSIYALASLGRTWERILCLGVYYHLVDPYLAFAQLRHCCEAGAQVVLEGDVWIGGGARARFDLAEAREWAFVPTLGALEQHVRSCYFEIEKTVVYRRFPGANLVKRLVQRPARTRALLVLRATRGENAAHDRPPPHGLDRYDPRYPASDPSA